MANLLDYVIYEPDVKFLKDADYVIYEPDVNLHEPDVKFLKDASKQKSGHNRFIFPNGQDQAEATQDHKEPEAPAGVFPNAGAAE